MKNVLIVISALLITFGIVITLITLISCGFDLSKITNKKTVSESHTVEKEFSSIWIDDELGYYDIKIKPSIDDGTTIDFIGHEKEKLVFTVSQGILKIRLEDNRPFFDKIFSFSKEASIVVSVPAIDYNELKLDTTSGDVRLEGLSFKTCEIELTSGDLFLTGVSANELEVDSTSGEIILDKVKAGKAEIEVTSGEAEIRNSDINSISVSSTSGDVEIENTSAKVVDIDVTSGDVSSDGLIVSDLIKIDASSGDVELMYTDAARLRINTSSGDVTCRLLSPKSFNCDSSSGEVKYPSQSGSGECYVRCSSGDISITLTEIKRYS